MWRGAGAQRPYPRRRRRLSAGVAAVRGRGELPTGHDCRRRCRAGCCGVSTGVRRVPLEAAANPLGTARACGVGGGGWQALEPLRLASPSAADAARASETLLRIDILGWGRGLCGLPSLRRAGRRPSASAIGFCGCSLAVAPSQLPRLVAFPSATAVDCTVVAGCGRHAVAAGGWPPPPAPPPGLVAATRPRCRCWLCLHHGLAVVSGALPPAARPPIPVTLLSDSLAGHRGPPTPAPTARSRIEGKRGGSAPESSPAPPPPYSAPSCVKNRVAHKRV